MARTRAKFRVTKVVTSESSVDLEMRAVTEKPFDAAGKSEDNDFAYWTPTGFLSMTINNPALLGAFKEGQSYYLDFTEAVE